MPQFNGVYLILGSLCLYSSMTCLYSPTFLPIPFTEVVPLKPDKNDSISFSNTSQLNQNKINTENKKIDQVATESTNQSEPSKNSLEIKSIKDIIVQKFQKEVRDVEMPKYTKGIYLSNIMVRSASRFKKHIANAVKYKLNTLVVDVQPRMLTKEHVNLIKEANLFPIARVVVFHGGLKTKYPSQSHISKIMKAIQDSAKLGFGEVQLDYIRYADYKYLQRLPLKLKYNIIGGILKKANDIAKKHNIQISADVFGRITLNQHDHIGQKLENFAKYMDTLYPMVYPSHYTGDKYRINHPYHTVKEGVLKSKRRLPKTRVVAYIQGFKMKIAGSGLSLSNYIKKQMQACVDAKGDGWIIWNPRNIYTHSYVAMQALGNHTAQKHKIAEVPMGNQVKKKSFTPEQNSPVIQN